MRAITVTLVGIILAIIFSLFVNNYRVTSEQKRVSTPPKIMSENYIITGEIVKETSTTSEKINERLHQN